MKIEGDVSKMSDPKEDSHMHDRGTRKRKFRWLKIVALVVVLVGVSFYIMHLTGHMPFMNMSNMS
jgi:hypothetical protein